MHDFRYLGRLRGSTPYATRKLRMTPASRPRT
jgi:hypothetical protein